MTEPVNEPTEDSVADGTQLPDEDDTELVEEGDAGVAAAGWDDEDDTDE